MYRRRRAHACDMCAICISGEYGTRKIFLQVTLEAVNDWFTKMSHDVLVQIEPLLAVLFVHEEKVEDRVAEV